MKKTKPPKEVQPMTPEKAEHKLAVHISVRAETGDRTPGEQLCYLTVAPFDCPPDTVRFESLAEMIQDLAKYFSIPASVILDDIAFCLGKSVQ